MQLPAYGLHDVQFLASDSLNTNIKKSFQTEQANNPNFAVSASKGGGTQPALAEPDSAVAGVNQERLRWTLVKFFSKLLKIAFLSDFLLWSKTTSKITKIEREKKNAFLSFLPGCLLGSSDITLRTGCLVSVFPLCGHLGSFLLFFRCFIYFFLVM